jgi:ArsR family transcriptional regulator
VAKKLAPDAAAKVDYERIAEASRVALGDQTRLQIIHILSKEPVSVGGLVERLGSSQPAVSHHLAMMKAHRIVKSERKGKNIFYSLPPDALSSIKVFLDSLQGA